MKHSGCFTEQHISPREERHAPQVGYDREGGEGIKITRLSVMIRIGSSGALTQKSSSVVSSLTLFVTCCHSLANCKITDILPEL